MKKYFKGPWVNIVLFLVTVLTTTLSGAEHSNYLGASHERGSLDFYLSGLWYSVPFVLILGCHEFGHYFMSKYHKLSASLPYFIPLWFGLGMGMPQIGSMGAIIKLKNKVVQTKQQFFDVGIAGPIAGFIVALIFISYGFLNLPAREVIFDIHPEYEERFESKGLRFEDHAYSEEGLEEELNYFEEHGYEGGIPMFSMGSNLVFYCFENWVVSDKSKIPNKYEMIHYPFLFAGFVALLFTALNLLPIGQLDGGHVLFGLIGEEKHRFWSRVIFVSFVLYAGLGMDSLSLKHNLWSDFVWSSALYVGFLYFIFKPIFEKMINVWTLVVLVFGIQFIGAFYFPQIEGYSGWLLFSAVLSRFMGVFHPPVLDENIPLSFSRKVIGWVALLIFIVCASPQPFEIEFIGG